MYNFRISLYFDKKNAAFKLFLFCFEIPSYFLLWLTPFGMALFLSLACWPGGRISCHSTAKIYNVLFTTLMPWPIFTASHSLSPRLALKTLLLATEVPPCSWGCLGWFGAVRFLARFH